MKDAFSEVVQKIEDLFDLTSKSENPDSTHLKLEQRSGDVTKNNDEFLLATWSYFNPVADWDIEWECIIPQFQFRRISRPSSSTMSNHLKPDSFIAILKMEEAQKQKHAAFLPVKQKQETSILQKEHEKQMERVAMQNLEGDNRQLVSGAKLKRPKWWIIVPCLVTTRMNKIELKIGIRWK